MTDAGTRPGDLIDPEATNILKAFLGRKRTRPRETSPASRDPMFRRSGSSFDLKSIREYQNSDDPRRIDWRLAARSGRLYVKEYYEEEHEGAVILVDLSPSVSVFGDLEVRKMGATIAWLIAALGMPTSIHAFAARPLRRLERPRGGLSRKPISSFFEGIKVVGEDAAGTDIVTAIKAARASSHFRRLVAISDFFDPRFKPAASPFSRNAFIRVYRSVDTLFSGAIELDVADPESGSRIRLPWDSATEKSWRRREDGLDRSLGEARRRGAFYRVMRPGDSRADLYWSFLEALHA